MHFDVQRGYAPSLIVSKPERDHRGKNLCSRLRVPGSGVSKSPPCATSGGTSTRKTLTVPRSAQRSNLLTPYMSPVPRTTFHGLRARGLAWALADVRLEHGCGLVPCVADRLAGCVRAGIQSRCQKLRFSPGGSPSASCRMLDPFNPPPVRTVHGAP